MKRPAFQFYPGDWLQDASLRMCSIGARGLWIDMICLMHQGTPYGYLKVNHKDILPANLARMTGVTIPEVEGYLEELESAGVFERDENNSIYSRRMVRDEQIRQNRAAGGVKGGNPALKRKKKDNEEVDEKVNLQPNLQPTPSSSSSINNLTTPLARSRDDVLRDIHDLRVPDTPANNTDWVNAFLGLGYAHHELLTASLVPMYAAWCQRRVSLGMVLDAMDVATARLGRLPDNPGYLRNIVEDLLRQSSRSPPGRGQGETARTTTGGNHADRRNTGSAVDRVIAANAHALGIEPDAEDITGECYRI